MFKPAALVALLLLFFTGRAQEVSLPADLRQHTLTQYNASLFNPAFSLNRNNPQSIAFWTRWQWQNVDADPTTLFLNYSRRLNKNSAVSGGFFQHNTGIYFNTGGALNYAFQIEFNRLIKLSFGANVFGFQQQLADTRFPVNPIPGIPQSTPTDDFILQVAPGFNLQVENFSMSLASENLFDYNFTDKAANTATSDKIFMGMASYDFPIMASDSTAYIRPSIYLRTIPEQENQIGLNALFSTKKYWVQSGYNNFYGISVGAGGTVFNRFSLGALVEFGTSASLNSKDPSFEIIASYFLGNPEKRRPLIASGIIDEHEQVVLAEEKLTNEEMQEELKKAEKLANQKRDETGEVEEPEIIDENQVTQEELLQTDENTIQEETKSAKKEARRLAAEQKVLEKQQRRDSIAEDKKERETLALREKQEEVEAKREAEEAEKAAAIAEAEKLREQESLEKEAALAEAQRIEQQRKSDSINDVRKAAVLKAKEQKQTDSIKAIKEKLARLDAEKLREQQRQKAINMAKDAEKAAEAQKLEERRKLDSINIVKKEEAIAEGLKMKAQKRLDSIAKDNKTKELAAQKAAAAALAEKANQAVQPEVVKPEAGEKYEEVANEDGLEPGYYLIANVFGTKKYFDAFMRDLTNNGIQAKSFFRSRNKYNYAYLERYETISAARQARDSNFNGKYNGKTWIFRVVGQ